MQTFDARLRSSDEGVRGDAVELFACDCSLESKSSKTLRATFIPMISKLMHDESNVVRSKVRHEGFEWIVSGHVC